MSFERPTFKTLAELFDRQRSAAIEWRERCSMWYGPESNEYAAAQGQITMLESLRAELVVLINADANRWPWRVRRDGTVAVVKPKVDMPLTERMSIDDNSSK